MNQKYLDLANRIDAFLAKYAAISPNSEDGEKEYTGPDPYQLQVSSELLKKDQKPYRCWSEWGSGCYKPYSSKEGREEHDSIVSEVCDIINKK